MAGGHGNAGARGRVVSGVDAVTAFVALFVVIDPIGMPRIGTALAGEAVLGFVGISMPAFRIAGGMLLVRVALAMLFEKRQPKRAGRADAPVTDPSVFLLALPLTAGAGVIAAMIPLTAGTGAAGTGGAIGDMLAVIAVVWALFLLAAPMEPITEAHGHQRVTRLLGMLLAALSVQFVPDGQSGLPGW